ncbi:MAG: VOC family protein [Armatimonadetes bacterium]|nr:VOC family protein [Armatimonadota bacterium]
MLAIFPTEAGERPIPDWFHFGFSLPSGAQVEALYDEMRAAGVKSPAAA